jgi:hypothetical protein
MASIESIFAEARVIPAHRSKWIRRLSSAFFAQFLNERRDP